MRDLSRGVICHHVRVTDGYVTGSSFFAAHTPAETSPVACKLESGWRGRRCWRVLARAPCTLSRRWPAFSRCRACVWPFGCPRARTMTSAHLAFLPHLRRFDWLHIPACWPPGVEAQRTGRCGLHPPTAHLLSRRWVHIAMSGALARPRCVGLWLLHRCVPYR